jgi:type III pantothenate kinase
VSSAAHLGLVAVDIGNSRLKFGLYPSESRHNDPVPVPSRWLDVAPPQTFDRLEEWLAPLSVESTAWWIASVNRPHTTQLLDWLRSRADHPRVTLVASGDLPLSVSLPRPDMVGIDRLLGAVAANRLRSPERSAVVIDLGTAITVDLVAANGSFQGGAILPGIGLSARALHQFTDLLPLLDMAALAEPPPALGTSTDAALRSGLYWGAVGGCRELIARLQGAADQPPQVFLTGGAAPAVAGLLANDALYVPHLVLGGIAIAAAAAKTP